MTSPTAPDAADTGNGTKRESKYGIAVTFVLSVLSTAAIGYLTTLDLSSLPGWAASAAALAVSGLIGYLAAYKTPNMVSRQVR